MCDVCLHILSFDCSFSFSHQKAELTHTFLVGSRPGSLLGVLLGMISLRTQGAPFPSVGTEAIHSP